MAGLLIEKQDRKTEDRYWNYIVKCTMKNKDALPLEKYRRYAH